MADPPATGMGSAVTNDKETSEFLQILPRSSTEGRAYRGEWKKYASLVVLTLLGSSTVLLMGYVRSRPGKMFKFTTVVFVVEVVKVFTCVIMVIITMKGIRPAAVHLYEKILMSPSDCLKMAVPACIYNIQNNLVFVAVSNMSPVEFQVTFQFKIFTTALFSVIMLRRRLSLMQWVALFVLFCGVCLVQVKDGALKENASMSALDNNTAVTAEVIIPVKMHHLLGLMAVSSACIMSGFAGVFFEKILKNTDGSVWLRNIQLGMFGSIIGVLTMGYNDGQHVVEHGFFYGYDGLVFTIILLQALGGLTVAVVVKYADNILKGFANSASIILSCIISFIFLDFHLTVIFCSGTSLVMLSGFLYTKYPPVTKIIEMKPEEGSTKDITETKTQSVA